MGPWTYYSPLLIGILITAIGYQSVLEHSVVIGWPEGLRWGAVAAVALLRGLALQLAMIGLQGVLAQVVPVPSGRSIRGRAAVLIGVLTLATQALGVVALLVWGQESVVLARYALAAPVATGLAALIAYGWSWPVAARDFARDA